MKCTPIAPELGPLTQGVPCTHPSCSATLMSTYWAVAARTLSTSGDTDFPEACDPCCKPCATATAAPACAAANTSISASLPGLPASDPNKCICMVFSESVREHRTIRPSVARTDVPARTTPGRCLRSQMVTQQRHSRKNAATGQADTAAGLRRRGGASQATGLASRQTGQQVRAARHANGAYPEVQVYRILHLDRPAPQRQRHDSEVGLVEPE